jgi:hypothetical protein
MLLLVRKDEENAKDDNDEQKAVHVTCVFIPPAHEAVNG